VCCRSGPWGWREERECHHPLEVVTDARVSVVMGCDSAHSQVIFRVMLVSHQEGQSVIGLKADCGVADAQL
jgi:hypothetical protein